MHRTDNSYKTQAILVAIREIKGEHTVEISRHLIAQEIDFVERIVYFVWSRTDKCRLPRFDQLLL